MTREKIIVALLMLAMMPCVAMAFRMDPEAAKLDAIINNPATDKAEKIRLLKLRLRGERWRSALFYLDNLDHDEAVKTAREEFARPDASAQHKLEVGKTLFEDNGLNDPGFIDIYGPFLIEGVLHGGEEQFMKVRFDEVSFVGEYAFFAAGFEGQPADLFSKIADKRVAPILARCLNAPDHVARYDGGGFSKGESMGRNTQRQCIPIALLRLGAADAIPALQKTITNHTDVYERYNAGLALGQMLSHAESVKLAASLKAHLALETMAYALLELAEGLLKQGVGAGVALGQKWPHDEIAKLTAIKERLALARTGYVHIGLGEGLLRHGDDAGVELLSLKYDAYFNRSEPSYISYMLGERLDVIAKSDLPGTERFYREALEHPPLRQLWMTEQPERSLRLAFAKIADRATAQKLRGLVPLFEGYAKESTDPDVRRFAANAVAALAAEKRGE